MLHAIQNTLFNLEWSLYYSPYMITARTAAVGGAASTAGGKAIGSVSASRAGSMGATVAAGSAAVTEIGSSSAEGAAGLSAVLESTTTTLADGSTIYPWALQCKSSFKIISILFFPRGFSTLIAVGDAAHRLLYDGELPMVIQPPCTFESSIPMAVLRSIPPNEQLLSGGVS